MFSAAGLFVTFLDIHLSVGKYQAIVAGIALVLTAVQNPDGLTSTSTGKGPAVALMKLRDRVLGLRKTGAAGAAPAVDRRRRRHSGHGSGLRQARRPPPGCLTLSGLARRGRAVCASSTSPARSGSARRGHGCRGGSRTGRARQLGYRIRTDNGWDSGRVESSDSVLVEYAGPLLRSGERVTWQVKVWTDAGESDWSDPDVFELGLLDPGGLVGALDRAGRARAPAGGAPAGDARARRVRAPGRTGRPRAAVRDRARDLRGVRQRPARRRRRADPGLHRVPRPAPGPGLRHHRAGAARPERDRRDRVRRLVPRPGRAAARPRPVGVGARLPRAGARRVRRRLDRRRRHRRQAGAAPGRTSAPPT